MFVFIINVFSISIVSKIFESSSIHSVLISTYFVALSISVTFLVPPFIVVVVFNYFAIFYFHFYLFALSMELSVFPFSRVVFILAIRMNSFINLLQIVASFIIVSIILLVFSESVNELTMYLFHPTIQFWEWSICYLPFFPVYDWSISLSEVLHICIAAIILYFLFFFIITSSLHFSSLIIIVNVRLYFYLLTIMIIISFTPYF